MIIRFKMHWQRLCHPMLSLNCSVCWGYLIWMIESWPFHNFIILSLFEDAFHTFKSILTFNNWDAFFWAIFVPDLCRRHRQWLTTNKWYDLHKHFFPSASVTVVKVVTESWIIISLFLDEPSCFARWRLVTSVMTTQKLAREEIGIIQIFDELVRTFLRY